MAFPRFSNFGAILLLVLLVLIVPKPAAATFPLSIPSRPTTFPLSRPPAGELVAWGLNDAGQATIPANATNMVAVAANYKTSLGLRNDGIVLAWGAVTNYLAPVPSGLANVVAISLGSGFAVALRSDGTVVSWGYPGLNAGDPSNLRNIVAIAAGSQHSLALKSDGVVIAWGGGSAVEVPPNLTNVVAVAAGQNTSYALRADGSIVSWGTIYANFTHLNAVTDVVGIFGHGMQGPRILALRSDGSIVDNTENAYFLPLHLKATAASLSYGHTIAINSDRTVKVWESYGSVYGFGVTNIPPRLRNVIAVAAGYDHVLAIKLPSPPIPTAATAVAEVINGFVVALRVVDGGEGYAQQPQVTISSTNGTGASAVARISNGIVTGFTMTDAGSGYTHAPKVTVEPPLLLPLISVSPSRVNVIMHLTPGENYQLESSAELPDFAAIGTSFVAQASAITNEFTLSKTNQFFRFRETP